MAFAEGMATKRHEEAQQKILVTFRAFLWLPSARLLFPASSTPRFYQIVDKCKVPVFGQGEFAAEITELHFRKKRR
jgi:hypothetical protein